MPVCVEASIDRGYCVYTISDTEFWVDEGNLFQGKTWWELRPTMVMVPASSWASLKSFILKTCKERGTCGDVGSWETKLNRFDMHLEGE